MRSLLVRGMLVGAFAALLAFVFAKVFGEPQVDKAIHFEDLQAAAAHEADTGGGPVVTRGVQAGVGLLLGMTLYGIAIGGIFSLVFALVQGRVGRTSARVTSAWLAAAAFVVIVLVPFLKYPANPPAVSVDTTLGHRTQLFFVMLLISIVAAVAAVRIGQAAIERWGGWNGALAGIASYIVLVGAAMIVMPDVNEMPRGFAPEVLYHFRLASLGIHAVLWTAIGLTFGALTERSLRTSSSRSASQPAPA